MTRRSRPFLIYAFILLLVSNLITTDPALADPIKTNSALTFGFAGTAVRSFAGFTRLSNSGKKLDIIVVPLIIPFRFTGKTVGTVIVPYLNKDFEDATGKESTEGIGDISLRIKHAFYIRDVKGGTTRLAFTGGLRLPSGSDSEIGRDGKRLPPGMQLGLGSVGFLLGGSFSTIDLPARYQAHAAITYVTNAEANTFKAGDLFQYDFAFIYRLYPARYEKPFEEIKQLNLLLEINGQHSDQSERDGVELPDSGGDRVLLSPGLQFMASPRLLFEANFQWPILENLKGNQLEMDYITLAGFRYLF